MGNMLTCFLVIGTHPPRKAKKTCINSPSPLLQGSSRGKSPLMQAIAPVTPSAKEIKAATIARNVTQKRQSAISKSQCKFVAISGRASFSSLVQEECQPHRIEETEES